MDKTYTEQELQENIKSAVACEQEKLYSQHQSIVFEMQCEVNDLIGRNVEYRKTISQLTSAVENLSAALIKNNGR